MEFVKFDNAISYFVLYRPFDIKNKAYYWIYSTYPKLDAATTPPLEISTLGAFKCAFQKVLQIYLETQEM